MNRRTLMVALFAAPLAISIAAAQADESLDLSHALWAPSAKKAVWKSAWAGKWGQWDWSAGNAWNTGNELDVVPSPDGSLAAAVLWEDGLKVDVWDTASQELLTTVSSGEELREWVQESWTPNSKQVQQWRSWTEKVAEPELSQ